MNLLKELDIIKPTSLSRKLTLNGVTKIFPVYKININALYYNDQNDRIASWISQYKNVNGLSSLEHLPRDEYNDIIENFIVESNPQSIEKTQLNISVVGQREPGVVLTDGRIIDGNRRYTCIRRLAKQDSECCWFEAVILDVDLSESRKMIKMLELTIQHGEEKRVDYNNIETLIGVYQDIVESKLLTIEEYASSINESVKEVKKKVESSILLVEFLEYINKPKQFFIARDFQIYFIINEMVDFLNRISDDDLKEKYKKTLFLHILLRVLNDGRIYIKNLILLNKNNSFDAYYALFEDIEQRTLSTYEKYDTRTYDDIIRFAKINSNLGEELKEAMDDIIQGAKRKELFKKPMQLVNKTIDNIRELDVNLVKRMSPLEQEQLFNQVEYLDNLTNYIKKTINPSLNEDSLNSETKKEVEQEVIVKKVEVENKKNYEVIKSKLNDFVYIDNIKKITSLIFTVNVKLMYENLDAEYEFFFIDDMNEVVSEVKKLSLSTSPIKLLLQLDNKVSNIKNIYLAIRKQNDEEYKLRFLIDFPVDILFVSDFDI